MHTAAILLVLTSVAFAQEIGFTAGANVASGPSAISHPNVNNGWQSDSSFFVGNSGDGQGSSVDSGGSLFNNVFGSSFTSVNSNSASKDNIINNPSLASVSGNDGWTANGNGNNMGPAENTFGVRRAASAIPVFKRGGDVVFADNHHQASAQFSAAGAVPVTQFVGPSFVQPGFVHPGVIGGAVLKRSGDVVFADSHHQTSARLSGAGGVPVAPFAYPGLFKRAGDIVFANNHHQVDAAAGFVSDAAAPFLFGWSVVQPFVSPLQLVQPVVAQPIVEPVAGAPAAQAQEAAQKATIIQNQA
ncbi:hypothetical protein GQ54DRAFT_252822 [Martensiomyces pterosporus]|nr:hypothetical protein GQ54DRAFT_252822 [Martensiomyces pterosporus]